MQIILYTATRTSCKDLARFALHCRLVINRQTDNTMQTICIDKKIVSQEKHTYCNQNVAKVNQINNIFYQLISDILVSGQDNCFEH